MKILGLSQIFTVILFLATSERGAFNYFKLSSVVFFVLSLVDITVDFIFGRVLS